MLKSIFATTTMLFLPLCAEIIHIEDLSDDRIENFCSGGEPQTILELCEGSKIPFSLFMNGDYVELAPEIEGSCLHVKRNVFIRVSEGGFLFSEDLSIWKEFKDFFAGKFSVLLKNQDNQPRAGIIIELNQNT